MPTDAERVATTRTNYLIQLEELSDPAKRRPSYSIGGRSVQWPEYQRFLLDAIKQLDSVGASGDPGEVVTAIV